MIKGFSMEKVALIKQLGFEDKNECIVFLNDVKLDDSENPMIRYFIDDCIRCLNHTDDKQYSKIMGYESYNIFDADEFEEDFE